MDKHDRQDEKIFDRTIEDITITVRNERVFNHGLKKGARRLWRLFVCLASPELVEWASSTIKCTPCWHSEGLILF